MPTCGTGKPGSSGPTSRSTTRATWPTTTPTATGSSCCTRRELDSLAGKVAQRGLTLVPTKLYFKNGRAKVELALAKGKEGQDKRRDIAKREADRDMQRALKSRR